MAKRCVSLASATGRKPVAGPAIVRKTRTCPFEGGSARCSASGAYERYRNSRPSTPRSQITSVRNVTSPAGTSSRPTAPPLLPSGAASARIKEPRAAETETGSHLSGSTNRRADEVLRFGIGRGRCRFEGSCGSGHFLHDSEPAIDPDADPLSCNRAIAP